MARLFPSPVKVKGKKKKAMAEERVRDCDCARIINDHHGVPQLSESPPGTIYSGKTPISCTLHEQNSVKLAS